MKRLNRERMGEGGQQNLAQSTLAVVATLVEEDNDALLVELCDRLEQRVGVCIRRATNVQRMREAHWDVS